MPNWCTNRLTIFGPIRWVDDVVLKAHGARQEYAGTNRKQADLVSVFSFHQLVPIPPEVLAGPYDPNGYQMEHELWGCKWGASEARVIRHVGGEAVYQFETPWGPPGQLLRTLHAQYPTLTWALSFQEETPSRGRLLFAPGKSLRKSLCIEETFADFQALREKVGEDAAYQQLDIWHQFYLQTHDEWIEELKGRTKSS